MPALAELTPEQSLYIKKWSWGAFFLPMIYFFANGLVKQGFLMFIPIYDIYLWLKGAFRGRKMAWEQGYWRDFAMYQERQRLLDRVGVILFIIFITMFVLMGVTAYRATLPPTKAARAFLQDIASGSLEKAYQNTSSQFTAETSKEDFINIMQTHGILSQIADISLTSRSIKAQGGITTAKIEGTLTGRDGSTSNVVVDLIKTNENVWEILSLFASEPIPSNPQPSPAVNEALPPLPKAYNLPSLPLPPTAQKPERRNIGSIN